MRNKIYCHTKCTVNKNLSFEKGEYYETVIDYKTAIKIGKIHLRCYKEHCAILDYPKEFDKYFYTTKQLRKQKLEKIWKNQETLILTIKSINC